MRLTRLRMCTVLLLHDPDQPWPLVVAANRDELQQRPALPPGRHWKQAPALIGGLDTLGGGTWMAMHETGTLSMLLNRRDTLGPAPGFRSRGELPLLALRTPNADDAHAGILKLDLAFWRPFNLLIADASGAWWLEHLGDGHHQTTRLEEGRWVLHAGSPNDPDAARTALALPLLQRARHPQPDDPASWSDLSAILATPSPDPASPLHGVFIRTPAGFGTVSTSLLALPATHDAPPLRWAYTPQSASTFQTAFSEIPTERESPGDHDPQQSAIAGERRPG